MTASISKGEGSVDDDRSFGERSIDAATAAVNAASDRADQMADHLHRKVEAAKRPGTYIDMMRDATKSAPLAMLGAAFVGGIFFARRR